MRKTMQEFHRRARRKKVLDDKIHACRLCKGLNIPKVTECAVGYGNIMSNVVFLGQSLCAQCMETGIPFTEGSGFLLDRIFGLAGLRKWDVFITNVIHCHPQNNRTTLPRECINCHPWLTEELNIVRPDLIVALGRDATDALLGPTVADIWTYNRYTLNGADFATDLDAELKCEVLPVCHPAYFSYKSDAKGIDEYTEQIVRALKDVYHEFGS